MSMVGLKETVLVANVNTLKEWKRMKTSKKQCVAKRCERPPAGRGLCKMHHKRFMKHGDPEYIYVPKANSGTFTSERTTNENHPQWKGERPGYFAVHMWIGRHWGKAIECEECGTKSAKRYEWANISGLYHRSRDDWRQLCSSCHHKADRIMEKGWITRKARLV